MKKIIVISNTAFSIEKFRLHYLKYIANFKIDIYTPWRAAKINSDIKNINTFKFLPNNLFHDFFLINKIISRNTNSIIIAYSFKYQFILGIIRFFNVFDSMAIIAGKGSFFYKKTIKNTILKPFIRLLFSKYNRIICINKNDKDFFSKYLNNNIGIIPSEGVEYSGVEKIKNEKKKFIFFARLIKEKGVAEYIEIAKIFKKKYNHLNFYIAGSFDKKNIGQSNSEDIVDLIKKNSKYAKYIGYIKNYKYIFPKMDCLISPSYTEGAGTSVLEALMTRLFVIAYKNNGHNFILNKTKNIICDSNIKDLTLSVEKYLNIEKNKLLKITKDSRKHVIKNFTSPIIAKHFIKNLNKIIKSKNS